VNQRSSLQYPALYRQGQRNDCFNTKVQLGWALNGGVLHVYTRVESV